MIGLKNPLIPFRNVGLKKHINEINISKKPPCLMFFREINGADRSKRLTLAGNEGFLPTNHSLGPGSALEEKGEKN